MWSDPAIQVVIISPKVTVGASFNVPDIFDRVFAFATPRSVSIRTEFQMIFRVRRPKSPEVHLYIRDHRVPHKTILAEIRAQIEFDNATLLQLETNESKQKEIQAWRQDCKWLIEGVYAYNILEENLNKSDMLLEFMKMCMRTGDSWRIYHTEKRYATHVQGGVTRSRWMQ